MPAVVVAVLLLVGIFVVQRQSDQPVRQADKTRAPRATAQPARKQQPRPQAAVEEPLNILPGGIPMLVWQSWKTDIVPEPYPKWQVGLPAAASSVALLPV